MKAIKDKIKRILLARFLFKISHLKNRLWGGYENHYYSQSGEDIILKSIFRNNKSGFYVDVGAYHPRHYSNTHLLFEQGWRGINIDPNPDSIKYFNKERPRDINLNLGIADKAGQLEYFRFSHQSCNMFSREKMEEYKKQYKCFDSKFVKTMPLKDILDNYVSNEEHIDLLNIDVEGFDEIALRSNNWNRYKPKVIIVENLEFNKNNPEQDSIFKFLKERGYSLYFYTGISMIFTS